MSYKEGDIVITNDNLDEFDIDNGYVPNTILRVIRTEEFDDSVVVFFDGYEYGVYDNAVDPYCGDLFERTFKEKGFVFPFTNS